MSYESVDKLQKTLSDEVFHYAADKKKAAGRALGTLVEIITFYLLRSWEFRDSLAIERSIPEYGNPEISHNVEYSLHPILKQSKYSLSDTKLPLSSAKIRKAIWGPDRTKSDGDKTNQLLSSKDILRNCCTIAENDIGPWVVHLDSWDGSDADLSICRLHRHPFAMFECKRVGVEGGMKKGPQTIEKAKQGAYVARSVSFLQKIRLKDGQMGGILHPLNGDTICKEYVSLLDEIFASTDGNLLYQFTLSVGVVSNHGNWFTLENQNKELRVLAQSYDWLIFLTDAGLSDFINELLLNPSKQLEPAKEAFLSSYTGNKGKNRFTKVRMDSKADEVLAQYFSDHAERIASWFNVITPEGKSLSDLKDALYSLSQKDWNQIHNVP